MYDDVKQSLIWAPVLLLLVGSIIGTMYLFNIKDVQTQERLAKICIEQEGAWHQGSCIYSKKEK